MSKRLKKVCVIGHFGFGHNLLNGQTVKTKIVTDELEKRFPDEVLRIDTHGGVKNLIKAPIQIFKALKQAQNVVIFPAHNGLRVYAPLSAFARRFFGGRRLHYVVIGGWLSEFLEEHKSLAKSLRGFDGIYVETNTMKRALEAKGFKNIAVMPNCKGLEILSSEALIYSESAPYKLCTFSRVMREKGIEDIVNAVIAVNDRLGYLAYSLDIYGQVDAGQTEWFENLQKEFPEYVKYGGQVAFDKSGEVLRDYFALAFPTRFYTEGVPGTIIDGYAAGVPVISARWESFSDVVDDEATGYGFDMNDFEALTDLLERIAREPSLINSLKENCLKRACDFTPENAISALANKFD